LYLFDTFEGFDARDTEFEKAKGYSCFDAGYLNISSEEKVRKALPHPEKAIFRKGYFPETAAGIDDEFVFANLDFDLYKPTIAGLEFFWARLVPGGAMLVHDFTTDKTKGVRAACYEFSDRHGVGVAPIGDRISVVFAKNR
jgi:O-methyltransferase